MVEQQPISSVQAMIDLIWEALSTQIMRDVDMTILLGQVQAKDVVLQPNTCVVL